MTEKKITEVVAALIWDGGRFMICQRPTHKARGLLWEFVGGKVEPSETHEQALIRECREELDITISVENLFTDVIHPYPDLTVHLYLYHATIADGVPKLLEHKDLRWITPDEIPQFDFCPADVTILRQIVETYGDASKGGGFTSHAIQESQCEMDDGSVKRKVCDVEADVDADDDRLTRQMDFIRELDQEKEIFRQTFLCSGNRRENDAEHAWHMAIMAFLLEEYANEPIDLLKTIKMILIHDVVEIDAGDTYAYDAEGLKTQAEREKKAADRLFNILPADQAKDLYDLFYEFEAGETAEAKFAKTLDNIQPILLNSTSYGRDWEEKGVKVSQILNRQKRTPLGSVKLWQDFARPVLEQNVAQGHIVGDTSFDEVKISLPSPRPIVLDELTIEQLNAELLKGVQDIQKGKTYTADEVDAILSESFGI